MEASCHARLQVVVARFLWRTLPRRGTTRGHYAVARPPSRALAFVRTRKARPG